VRMSSASQNFPHHPDVLRERMLDPTDYELAVNYFLEEFAGDVAFLRASEPEQMPHLVAVLNVVVSKATGAGGGGRKRAWYRIRGNIGSCTATHRRTGVLCCSSTLRCRYGAAHADSRNWRPDGGCAVPLKWRPADSRYNCLTQPQRLSRAIRQVRINRVCRTALNACITFEPAQLSQEVSIRIASFS